MIRRFAAAAAVALFAEAAAAQTNELTLDATVVRGTLGYARQVAAPLLLGVEVGFGFPGLDQTLSPEGDSIAGEPDFNEYLHVGGFVRWRPNRHFEMDSGVRASIADLWECTASDCWPSLFGGVYIQPMIGGSRIKVGARLTAGVIGEQRFTGRGSSDGNTSLVSLAPLLVRVRFPW